MKRFVLISLIAVLGVGTGAALALARAGGERATTALRETRHSSPVSQTTPSATAPSEEPSEAPAAALCDPEVMMAVISKAIEAPAQYGMYWDHVEIAECQNGYAQVFAHTGGTPPPGTNLEGSEQVFLQDVGGEWTVLSSGSGLDCYPGSMPPDLKDACEGLDLA